MQPAKTREPLCTSAAPGRRRARALHGQHSPLALARRAAAAGHIGCQDQESHRRLQKGVGTADGLAELMVFYCEQASGFSNDVSLDDEGYFEALVGMFGQALKAIDTLPQTQRPALLARLDAVRQINHAIGYGVGEDMDSLLHEHGGYG